MRGLLPVVACLLLTRLTLAADYAAELIFPLDDQHNHAPSVVQLENGDLFACWYRGSGERKADDVAVMGAWKRAGTSQWSKPQVMFDQPGFPDCNTAMHLDPSGRLWLFWPTIIANSWESCLTRYQTATDFSGPDAPHWEDSGLVLLKPEDFSEPFEAEVKSQLNQLPQPVPAWIEEELAVARQRLGDKLYQRLGWQPRCKPTVLDDGRWLLPLYTDTFSISIMAISDDQGRSWHASKPLIGLGNIQPAVLQRRDGSLVAYMRENGISGHIRVAESTDRGETWSPVTNGPFPNPGSGLDAVKLENAAK